MTHFRYIYNPEFSCIIKLTENGTEVQRFNIPRCDLMKVAMVCWENSSDKLFLQGEQE